MRMSFLYEGVLVAATLCVAPAALPASPKAAPPGADTVASGKGAFPTSASNLLQQVQSDALSVRNNADQLQARLHEGFWSDWQSYANLLDRMRTRVNAMDKLLFQLRTNESTALPWQRQAIERIAPTVVNLSNTTEGAIVSLNNNKEHVYLSNLPGLAGDMYNQAMRIDQAIADFQKYANARHEAQQLRQTLGLKNNS